MFKKFMLMILAVTYLLPAKADEGMWLPFLIDRLNQRDMERLGLQLTASEIYDVNNSSLKDAIVNLNGGSCTGEIISPNGLMLTNHHCAYRSIQSHTSVENDYLANGFWAANYPAELPNPGMFVQFLIRIEDVTEKILGQVTPDMSNEKRQETIDKAIRSESMKAKGDTHYDVVIRPFFEGNEYYLFVLESFHDVRLVGAPPESIGKFGGDTDNWMWPRQTGDFALYRVYSGPDGKPAPYAKENIPLKPKHYLPVSLEGVKENDFAMVLGYPGSTDRYLSSTGVQLAIDQINPTRVNIREQRLAVMREFMEADRAVDIQYASKYASVSNYWKYFIGQTAGLKRLKVYEKKKEIEKNFKKWVSADPDRRQKYGDPVQLIDEGYDKISLINIPFYYMIEAGLGVEMVSFGSRIAGLERVLQDENLTDDKLENSVKTLKSAGETFFKDYNATLDEKMFHTLLGMMKSNLDEKYHPEFFKALQASEEPYFAGFNQDGENDLQSLAAYIYTSSILVSKEKFMAFLENPELEKLKNDPGYKAAMSVISKYREISAERGAAMSKLGEGYRLFVAGLREMNPDKNYYPNANSTMRLTFGQVLGYKPKDAVHFKYISTMEGVMEKEDPNHHEFNVPDKLKALHDAKDYGDYAEDGILYVNFLTNHDITGGNSGSPVINAKGHLIGTAFDGNWEAMSGDIAFEPELQRCIAVDIRYTLFIIDKFAGAKHLIDEMTVVYPEAEPAKKGRKRRKSR
jgi:hypothetical protein